MMGESPVKHIFKVFNAEFNEEDAEESFVGLDDSLPDLNSYQADSLLDIDIEMDRENSRSTSVKNVRKEEILNQKENKTKSPECKQTESVKFASSHLHPAINAQEINQNKTERKSIIMKDPLNFNMKASFKFVKVQFDRLYNFKYEIGGMLYKKYRIFTTQVDGKSVKVFIPENDPVSRNVNNLVVDFQRITIDKKEKYSRFNFEISR